MCVKPYYRAEDLAGLTFLDASPGVFPYVRGTHSGGEWRIREEIDAVDPEEANQRGALRGSCRRRGNCIFARSDHECFRPWPSAREPGRDSGAF